MKRLSPLFPGLAVLFGLSMAAFAQGKVIVPAGSIGFNLVCDMMSMSVSA